MHEAFRHQPGEEIARGFGERSRPQLKMPIVSGGRLRGGGHWSRDIRFSRDGRKMYVSVGSYTNVLGIAG